MKIHGLQDGLRPSSARDVLHEAGMMRMDFMAEPGQESGGGGSQDEPKPTPEPEPEPAPGEESEFTGRARSVIKDRNAKISKLLAENIAYKKSTSETDAMRAELDALKKAEDDRKKAEMSEVERANAEAAEAKAALEAAQAETARMTRETAAVKAGIDPMLIGPVALQMLAAKLDLADDKAVTEYFAALKADRPKWFVDSTPAPAAAGGPQSSSGDPETVKMIARMEELQKTPRMNRTVEQQSELSSLLIRKQRIEAGGKEA